jgi:hypothetical protein
MRLRLQNFIIPLALFTGWFSLACADELQLAENAPSRYTVVKGDTLWDISGRFLKKPWRWPEIWNMNREQIKNPHWIYPGDVIALNFVDGKPRLSVVDGGSKGAGGTTKLSPRIRESKLDRQAIPSIPSAAIEPFLTRPLVIEENGLATAPTIIATEGERVIIGAGNQAYVEGIGENQGDLWQVYRPGQALKDPDNGEVLAYEAIYLGEARLTRGGEIASVAIVRSTEEINKGDRLVPATSAAIPSYSPHSPEKMVKGRIMSAPKGIDEIGQNAIVTVNKGTRDGLEVGHVLAAYRLGATVKAQRDGEDSGWLGQGRTIKLPDERNGLIFIFRTFEKVSYGLVVQSLTPLHLGDVVQSPEN